MKTFTLINKFNGEKTVYTELFYTDWDCMNGYMFIDINLKVWFISVEHSEFYGTPVVDLIKTDCTEHFVVAISDCEV